MAEYVRRRRPPPTHPYWERLRDRTHPPRLLLPIGIPSFIGLGIGLIAGMGSALSFGEAISKTVTCSSVIAAIAFLLFLPFTQFNSSLQYSHRERWPAALLLTLFMALFAFVTSMVILGAVLMWFAVCSGMGPWLGMTIGSAIGGVPALLARLNSRKRWRERQRAWPQWEQMRARRGGRARWQVGALAENLEDATTDTVEGRPEEELPGIALQESNSVRGNG